MKNPYPKSVIIHNYDPEYNARYYQEHKEEAKQYYEQHKKLKGRSTSGLNEEGKLAALYLKKQLNEERKKKVESSKLQRDSDIDTASNLRDATISSSKTQMESSIKQHSSEMQSGIDRLNNKLKHMSAKEKRIRAENIKTEIAILREKNANKKAELQKAYKLDAETARSEYKKSSDSAKETHKSNTEQYKTDYDNKYADAIDSLHNDSRYVASKKSKNKNKSNYSVKRTNYSMSELKKMTNDYKKSK